MAGAYQTALTYYFRVRAKSVNNFTAYTSVVSAKLIFNAPSGLTYSFYDDTKIKLTWSDDSNFETGFEIEQSSDNINFVKVKSVGSNVNSVDISGAFSSASTYYFRVFAKTEINVSSYSNTVSAVVIFSAPSNLAYSFYDDTKLKLNWTDNSNSEVAFEIELSYDNVNFVKVAEVAENVTTVDLPGSYHSTTTFYCRVRAKSTNNVSSYTNVVSAVVVLNGPTNLTYSFYDDVKLNLSWIDNSTIETGFEIELCYDNVNFVKVAEVAANVTTVDLPGSYHTATTFYTRVRAKSTNNVSSYSNVVPAVVVFNSPSNLSYSFYDDTKLKLTWQDNSNFETGFDIEQSTDSITFTKITETAANTTTVDVTGSYLTQIFYFRVRAKTNINYSNYSNKITATLIVAPTGFVYVQGGTFTMGDPTYATPLHFVTLSGYYISKTEVTQGQYKAIMGTNPSNFSSVGDNGPVEQVTWYDCISYCNKLSIKEGKTPCYSINGNTSPSDWTSGTIVCDFTAKGYRLATEAEWEYAARGGKKSSGYTYSGSNTLNDVAWKSDNSGSTTHAVGTKTANELGLYDMSGNVWEWCWDWSGSYSSSPQTNPTGATSGSNRILRGGSFNYSVTYYFLPGFHDNSAPSFRIGSYGFRVVLEF